MKKVLILILIFNTFLLASSVKKENTMDREVQKQILREKKYAKEQTFYQAKDYDLKSYEVNKDSIKKIPDALDIDYSDDNDVLEMD
jgi:hypothetical protein